jgi:hypothetical protein
MNHEQALMVTADTLLRVYALSLMQALVWIPIAAGLLYLHARWVRGR